MRRKKGPSDMKKEYRMSEERHQELKEELNYLKTVREKEVAELIKEARGFGDLSENSEYDEAKNEQGKLYSRIAEIEDILLHAVVITDDDAVGTSVTIGSRVTVAEIKSGEEVSCSFPIVAQATGPQAIGSAMTYARRYTLTAILEIVTGDGADDDGEAAENNHNTPSNGTTRNPSARAAADALGF